jgi:hypothetical protein
MVILHSFSSHCLAPLQVVNLWGYTLDFGDSYWKFSLLGALLNFINLIATTLDLVYIGPTTNFTAFSFSLSPSHRHQQWLRGVRLT